MKSFDPRFDRSRYDESNNVVCVFVLVLPFPRGIPRVSQHPTSTVITNVPLTYPTKTVDIKPERERDVDFLLAVKRTPRCQKYIKLKSLADMLPAGPWIPTISYRTLLWREEIVFRNQKKNRKNMIQKPVVPCCRQDLESNESISGGNCYATKRGFPIIRDT